MILSYNKFLKTIVVFYVYAILFFPTFLVYICLILLFLLKNNDVAYDILRIKHVPVINIFLSCKYASLVERFLFNKKFRSDFLLNKKRSARDVHPSEKKKVTKVTCAWCVKFRKGHSLLH